MASFRTRFALPLLGLFAACSSTSSSAPRDASQGPSHDAGHDEAARPSEAAAADATTDVDAFGFDAGDEHVVKPSWMTAATIFVDGFEAAALGQEDCRTQICQHNEDTDMIAWNGAIYLVHRTAMSQVLGPNSSLLVYRSTDNGATFDQVARIPAPMTPIDSNDDATMGRDIRDPAFFVVTDASGTQTLHLKAITRLPTNVMVSQMRDSNVTSISVGFVSKDGLQWGPLARLGPNEWSFWRVKQLGGVFYSAAYHDGDSSVSLFSSPDGVTWTQGAQVFGVTTDTPLETEIMELPNGNMLAIVRTDGSDADLAGNDGNQRTHFCWASPPYASFYCPETVVSERLDGPVAFFWQGRLFVIARRHVDTNGVQMRKRTSLFELSPALVGTGDAGSDAGDGGVLVTINSSIDAGTAMSGDWGMGDGIDGGTTAAAFNPDPVLAIKWWGDLPSAGDTAYAGVAFTDATHVRVVWYAGDIAADEDWYLSLLGPTNIWLGTIDMSLVH